MSEVEGARGHRWVRWVVPLATLVLLAVFARKVDWAHVWDAIVHADPVLLGIATLANIASLAVKGVRWALFLRAIGIRDVGLSIRAVFAGAALNNVLVANGGDAARVAAIARRMDVSSAPVLATVALDRLTDLVTYALIFVAAAFALPLPPELARWRTPGIIALGAMAAVVGVLVARTPKSESSSGTEVSDKATTIERARAYWSRLARAFANASTKPRLAAALALAFIAWVGQWATFQYAAHSASFPTTAGDSLLALLAVNASFLIRLTPGNVGVFQLLYTLAATSTGLDKDRAVGVAFLITVIQYIPITVIGLLLTRSIATGTRSSRKREPVRLTPFEEKQGMRIGGEQRRRT
jgi:uncharacterized protein (TIRG00374 family)